ncbi:hypothetical protein VP01_3173g1 [Puccinia sorghi]|uniref:Uncharacterized protein n=1 Tax=Puccinia sorghi TaxID=27349 RepID=A0A0L6UZH6_9BASI|nr:hypothetical protein VP01_3173g1 [Puccinia sorghi]
MAAWLEHAACQLQAVFGIRIEFVRFEKFNKTNEPLIQLDFDLDQSSSHNPAINSVQDILEVFKLADTNKLRHLLLIDKLMKSLRSILKQRRSLNRSQLNRYISKCLIEVEIKVLLCEKNVRSNMKNSSTQPNIVFNLFFLQEKMNLVLVILRRSISSPLHTKKF